MPSTVHLLRAVLSIIPVAVLSAMGATWFWSVGWITRRRKARLPILPAGREDFVPVGGLTVGLVFLLWIFISGVVSLAAYHVLRPEGKQLRLGPGEQMYLVAIVNCVLLLLVPPIIRWASAVRLADLGLTSRGALRQATIGLYAFLMITPAIYGTNLAAILVWKPNKHPLEQMLRSQPSINLGLLALLSAVFLAPAAEEILFRGILQGWLTKLARRLASGAPSGEGEASEMVAPSDLPSAPRFSRFRLLPRLPWSKPALPTPREETNPYVAPEDAPSLPAQFPDWPENRLPLPASPLVRALPVVLTSLAFALAHWAQWPAPIAIFFLSLGLGIVYQRTGSLLSAMVMHGAFNGLSTLLLFLSLLMPAERPMPKAGTDRPRAADVAPAKAERGRTAAPSGEVAR